MACSVKGAQSDTVIKKRRLSQIKTVKIFE